MVAILPHKHRNPYILKGPHPYHNPTTPFKTIQVTLVHNLLIPDITVLNRPIPIRGIMVAQTKLLPHQEIIIRPRTTHLPIKPRHQDQDPIPNLKIFPVQDIIPRPPYLPVSQDHLLPVDSAVPDQVDFLHLRRPEGLPEE